MSQTAVRRPARDDSVPGRGLQRPGLQRLGGPERNGPLKGPEDAVATPQPKASGWHPLDWACEYVGTAGQLAVGFSVVALLEAPQAPGRQAIGSGDLRLILIGVAFGLLAAAVALSPIGRRSGAHLNPAVTFGFWLRKHTPARDAVGYAVAQTLGALTAAAVFTAVWGAWADQVKQARTVPAPALSPAAVAGIEAALTCGLMLTVFVMLSSSRSARWTPAVVTGVLAALIWAGAPHTGASMNPARSFGPDVVASAYRFLWCYVVGPFAGAGCAALLFAAFSRRRTLTAKLFHDPRYPSVHATSLPATPHPSAPSQHGR